MDRPGAAEEEEEDPWERYDRLEWVCSYLLNVVEEKDRVINDIGRHRGTEPLSHLARQTDHG